MNEYRLFDSYDDYYQLRFMYSRYKIKVTKVYLMIEKYFQESSQFIKQAIKIYAKWTRLVISTGISWNKTEALSRLKLFMTQKIYLKVKQEQIGWILNASFS